MAQRDESKYSNRLEDAQKARAAMLEKAKQRAEEARKKLDAGAPERAAAAAAKAERQRQKEEEKRLAAERAAAEAKAAEEARIKAEEEAGSKPSARKNRTCLITWRVRPSRRRRAMRGMPPAKSAARRRADLFVVPRRSFRSRNRRQTPGRCPSPLTPRSGRWRKPARASSNGLSSLGNSCPLPPGSSA